MKIGNSNVTINKKYFRPLRDKQGLDLLRSMERLARKGIEGDKNVTIISDEGANIYTVETDIYKGVQALSLLGYYDVRDKYLKDKCKRCDSILWALDTNLCRWCRGRKPIKKLKKCTLCTGTLKKKHRYKIYGNICPDCGSLFKDGGINQQILHEQIQKRLQRRISML